MSTLAEQVQYDVNEAWRVMLRTLIQKYPELTGIQVGHLHDSLFTNVLATIAAQNVVSQMAEIVKCTKRIVSEVTGAIPIDINLVLREGDIRIIISALEREFDVRIPKEKLEEISTIQQVIDAITTEKI